MYKVLLVIFVWKVRPPELRLRIMSPVYGTSRIYGLGEVKVNAQLVIRRKNEI